jgi:hypothetical protein
MNDLEKSIKKPKIVLNSKQKTGLFNTKREAIYDAIKNDREISYDVIMQYQAFQNFMSSLFGGGFSGISTAYVVKLDNLGRMA